jgi:DNA-binding MarR family transcriptional regulator
MLLDGVDDRGEARVDLAELGQGAPLLQPADGDHRAFDCFDIVDSVVHACYLTSSCILTCIGEGSMFRPIGYWLKEVDRLIEERFGRLLAEERLTRRHWQALNTIAAGPVRTADVDAALAPFEPTVTPVVDELVARGWVARTGVTVELTEEGRAAHATVSERVSASRKALTEGISAEEYASTVNVLERMAGNLRAATTGS